MNKFTILNRNGEVDLELDDGKYKMNGDIIIKNGIIAFIDNSQWTLVEDLE